MFITSHQLVNIISTTYTLSQIKSQEFIGHEEKHFITAIPLTYVTNSIKSRVHLDLQPDMGWWTITYNNNTSQIFWVLIWNVKITYLHDEWHIYCLLLHEYVTWLKFNNCMISTLSIYIYIHTHIHTYIHVCVRASIMKKYSTQTNPCIIWL